MVEIAVLTDSIGGTWIVQDHQDGTAQLAYRYGNDGAGGPIVNTRITQHVLASEVRAELTQRNIPLGAWPA